MAKASTGDSEFQDTDLTANVFEERAELLSRQELLAWSVESAREKEILRKLQGAGAKLLTGPRGCGKSTLLRKAYFNLLDSGDVLPAYVNYAKSLALEPLFHRQANALQLFRQWVLAKIVVGVARSFDNMCRPLHPPVQSLVDQATSYILALERGESAVMNPGLTPSQLLMKLEYWCKEGGFRRCVLLLDDAAHAFSPQQQREFFEIFREIKSRLVSPKAAVYPGITSYGPNLHVGHDAELVEAWSLPDEDYVGMMREAINKRLEAESLRLKGREDQIDLLALASFGVPRGFLNMVSQAMGIEEQASSRLTRASSLSAVEAHCGVVRSVFSSLSVKLPRYVHFIETGRELEHAVMALLKKTNRELPLGKKRALAGIAEPLDSSLDRVIGLLEYAGIIRRMGTVSRGEQRFYSKFLIHYGILINENALALGSNFSLKDLVEELTRTGSRAVVHTRANALLSSGYEGRCTIDLAPCQQCGAPRPSEDAKFCIQCGKQLADSSVYTELLQASIDVLPLTQKKINGLLKHTSIRTVQDVLLDEESREIRKAPYVGAVWARRIRNAADEFVSV